MQSQLKSKAFKQHLKVPSNPTDLKRTTGLAVLENEGKRTYGT